MTRLTSKGVVIALAIVGGGIVLAASTRPWVTGTVDDAVLGTSRITGTGTEVAPGLVALSLAALAAVIASTTSGRVVRVVTLVLAALCSGGLVVLVARTLLDPSGVLGRVAAASTGRTGTLETHASPSAWPWIALAGVVVLLMATVDAFLGARRWQGLSDRYDAPASGDRRGPRGERVVSDWDRLSSGEDPTAEDRPPPR